MNILLVTHSFAPLNKISSLRLVHWTKYWLKNGHRVTVLTTKKYKFDGPLDLPLLDNELLKVIEVEYFPFSSDKGDSELDLEKSSEPNGKLVKVKAIVRRVRGIIGSLFDIHDLWVPKAVRQGKKVLDNDKFDLIVSSYGPPCSHIVASRLSKASKIKWIADYRDLWSDNHIGSSKYPFSIIERLIENKTVGSYANTLVTISKPLAVTLSSKFSQNVAVIENGFDPDEYKGLSGTFDIKEFVQGEINIIYAGTIYPERRDPTILLQALTKVDKKVNVHFYGGDEVILSDIIKRTGFETAFVHGYRGREYILNALNQADILLMLESGSADADGVLTGKLFEYFAVKKPILGIGFDDNVLLGKVIGESGMGECFSEESADLIRFINEFSESDFICDEGFLSKYSRESQALRVLELY